MNIFCPSVLTLFSVLKRTHIEMSLLSTLSICFDLNNLSRDLLMHGPEGNDLNSYTCTVLLGPSILAYVYDRWVTVQLY